MGFTCGIVGLPNVGKSTLFNALTAAGAAASNYPFCTIEPNIGRVAVPDARLRRLASIVHPAAVVPTTLEFVDIAGIVRGASTGEGLGNQFLAQIREVDAIAHVVRCFDDPNVIHVDGAVNPRRDIEVVEAELVLKDLDSVERRQADAQRRSKGGDKKAGEEAAFWARMAAHLGTGRPARTLATASEEESAWRADLHLLTVKPVLYVCNVAEGTGAGDAHVAAVRAIAANEGAVVTVVSASVEAEVAELPPEEREEFLRGLGLAESGLDQVIREGYRLLRLVTFFTAGPKEVRAWTIPEGTAAPDAAGTIHSDFARGFIRAEIMRYEDLDRLGSEQAVREGGLLRVEGKEYRMVDGDVAFFRFNV